MSLYTEDDDPEVLGTISAGITSIEYGLDWAIVTIDSCGLEHCFKLSGRDLKDLAAVSGIVSPIVNGELEL